MRESTRIIEQALHGKGYRLTRVENLPDGDRLGWWTDGMTTCILQEYPGATGAELYLPATSRNDVQAVIDAVPAREQVAP